MTVSGASKSKGKSGFERPQNTLKIPAMVVSEGRMEQRIIAFLGCPRMEVGIWNLRSNGGKRETF